MNKKVLTSLILAVFVSLLATLVIGNFFSKKEISSQKGRNASQEIIFGEILVPIGVPFPYDCAGLCAQESLDIWNLLKDVAVFYIPSYILVYFILEVTTKKRSLSASK